MIMNDEKRPNLSGRWSSAGAKGTQGYAISEG